MGRRKGPARSGGAPVHVAAGQIYRGRRVGAPGRHLRVRRVLLPSHPLAPPVALCEEITRTGRRRGRKSDPPVRVFLALLDGWRMPPWYEDAQP